MSTARMRLLIAVLCLACSAPAWATMQVTALVDSVSAKYEDENGKTVSPIDVCKTPSPAGPIPIPFPVVATSQDKTASKTKVDGKQTGSKSSDFKTSTGDEPGTAGGVISSKNMGKAEYVAYSFDVKFEGKGVIRQFDSMLDNQKNTPPSPVLQGPVVTMPRSVPPAGEADTSVTEVSYIDASGNETKLEESSIIAMADGEFCLVCMAKGKVTAIHRLRSVTPKRKKAQKRKQTPNP